MSRQFGVLRPERDSCAYRGYLIRWSIFTLDKPDSRVWAERGSHFICWAQDVDAAKREIDKLLDPDPMEADEKLSDYE